MSQEGLSAELQRQVREDQPRERPPLRTVLLDVLLILVAFAAAGLVVGVVWPHVVDPVRVTRTDFGLLTGEKALSNRFDTDGWFAVLGALVCLVLGGALTWWRSASEVVTVVAVAVAAGVASLVAAVVGYLLGPDDPTAVLRHAKVGATALDVTQVSSKAAFFVWPVMALVGALVVLWTRSSRPAPSDVVQ